MSRLGMQGFEQPLLAICVVAYFVNPGTNSAGYSTNATINWNMSVVNRYNMWNPSTPNRITAPVDGYYKVGAIVRVASTHTDFNDWRIVLNADTCSDDRVILRSAHGTGGNASTSGSTIIKLKSGDFLTVGLPRAYALYSDASRFFAYEIRGVPATGSPYYRQ